MNGLEIGVDVMCDEAIALLTDNAPTVAIELARPKKHVRYFLNYVNQLSDLFAAAYFR